MKCDALSDVTWKKLTRSETLATITQQRKRSMNMRPVVKCHFESFTIATMTWLTVVEYLCHKWPRICSTYRKHFPSHSWLITGFVTTLIRRVPLVEQELRPTLPEHLSSPPVFSGVRGTQSLALCVCFVDRCLYFCTFSFDHCVVYSSSIYGGFWLPFWYLQTLLIFLHAHFFLISFSPRKNDNDSRLLEKFRLYSIFHPCPSSPRHDGEPC
jgi:hypothetical protein